MGRTADKDRVKAWNSRVNSGDKAYKKWFDRFNVEYLERLYIGEHDDVEGKYKINLCYPSVETRLSMMTVDQPFFRVEAKAPRSDDAGSTAEARAKLREDTLNCELSKPESGFMETTEMGVKEAHWAFAVAEIVYSNDFIDNPNAGKPILNEDGTESSDIHPDKYPDPSNKSGKHESVYVKRIPPEQFRVSMNPKQKLSECDWVGYYEEHYVSDIKANPNYSNTSGLKANGAIKKEYQDANPGEDNESKEGLVKLWKIWDNRARKRYVFVEGGEKFLLEEKWKIFPFAALRFHKLGKEWYPLPPMFNWQDPQKSLNKTRNAQMVFLDRCYSKWLTRDGAIEQGELDKLMEPREGVVAKTTGAAPLAETIAALQNAPMDASFWRNVPATKEDFVQISAVSSEQRGVPDSNTATQASIVDVNSKRRETKDATKVAAWFAEIGTIVLQTIEEYMALPYWVQTNVDPTAEGAVEEAAAVIKTWKQITSDQLGDLNYEVSVSVDSMSSSNDEIERQKWERIAALLGPALLPVLSESRLFTSKLTGFKSDRDLSEAQNAFKTATQMMQQMAQAKQGQGTPANPESDPMAMLSQMMAGGMQGGNAQ